MKFRSFAAIALLALAAPGLSLAKEKADPVLTAQTKEAFDKQADGIRAQMAAGGRYQFVKANERATVERRLNEIGTLLGKHVDDGKLGTDEKLQIVNAQEEVNAILSQRDSKRLVCEQRAPTGSHRPQSTCRTYGEVEMERRDTQELMRRTNAVGGTSQDRGG